MPVEQIDREAKERLFDKIEACCCDICSALAAEAFARHRIAERERVVGEIVAWLRQPGCNCDERSIAADIEDLFGGVDAGRSA